MTLKSALIQPAILFIILIIVISTGVFSIDRSKKNNQALAQKDIEITQLKEQIELLRDYRNNTSNDNLRTAVEVIDLTSLKGNKTYPLRCFRKSRGDNLNFQFLDQIDIKNEDLTTVCENSKLNNFLVITFSEVGKVTSGPYYGNFSFKEYTPKTSNLKEIASIQGGLYSWCDDVIALTVDNELFVNCSGTTFKLTIH